MKNKKRPLLTLALYSTMLLSHEALAAASGNHINYSLQPKLFDTQYIPSEQNQLNEALFTSGLGLNLNNKLVDFSLDYTFLGSVLNEESSTAGNLSQSLKASLHSVELNNLLGVNAHLNADSEIHEGGNSYQYQVTPSFSKSLFTEAALDLNLDISYNYEVNKPTAIDLEDKTEGFSLGLNGSTQYGRLSWKTVYSDSTLVRGQDMPTETTEFLDFNSSYKLVPNMHLELSSAVKSKRFEEGNEDLELSEAVYRAGISWSPSSTYSLAFKVNKVNTNLATQEELFGSGSIIWKPKQNLRFSIGYGDQLLEGNRGLVLSTKLNLDSSSRTSIN